MTVNINGATPTFIVTFGTNEPAAVKNQGPAVVFLQIGATGFTPTVTADQSSTGGYPLGPDEQLSLGVASGTSGVPLDLYGITAEGDAYVSFL